METIAREWIDPVSSASGNIVRHKKCANETTKVDFDKQEKKLYGKVSMGVVRTTYIIDEEGIIEKVMPKVKPDTNANEILEWLEA